MGDWDDEDFEVPTLNNSTLKKDWDDEEEEEIVTKVTLSAAQIEANTKKTKDEEIRLANVLKFAILEDETPEEKRARERKQIEDSDAVLAGEMFGGASTGAATSQKAAATIQSGVAGAVLSTKADHTNFGILCAKKLSDSTAFNVAAFYKSLTEKVQKNLSSESCDEILAVFTKIRDEKREIAKPAKAAAAKKSKSQVKAESKKHSDIFGGGDDYNDKYADYNAMEDDYM